MSRIEDGRLVTGAGRYAADWRLPGTLHACFVRSDRAHADIEAIDAAEARAAHRRVQVRLRHQRLVANPLEPRACVAAYDGVRDTYTLYTNIQGINALRPQLAAVTGIPEGRLRIEARDVGGGFGVRYNAYPEHCVLLLATRALGRPVRWVASRSESFASDEQGRGVVSDSEAAVDAEGRFLAFRFRFLCDMGAYLTATGPFIDIGNVIETLTGVYRTPVLYARFDLALTNTVPVGAYRGAGRPLASYAVERLVDEVAHETGIDPVTLRRRNFVPAQALPYATPHAGVIDSGDFAAVMAKALAAADWDTFDARRAQASERGRLRGIGMATYIEFSSPGYFPKDEVAIRFDPAGTVTLHAVTHSSGQSHETTFARIVAEVLGLAPRRFRLRTWDHDLALVGSATGGSRSLFGVGSVFKLAAEEVVARGAALAAGAFGVPVSEVWFDAGAYGARGTDRRVSLDDLIARHAGSDPHPLDVRMEAKFGGNYPNGCHVAEVEIDPETGGVRLERYTAVDDCGTVVDPAVVEGQIMGGVVQGAGQALMEEALFDPASGQLLSGSFMDYAMPRAGAVRAMTVLEHPVPTSSNPLGAKGAGEAGATGAPPAVMNAVMCALRAVGVRQLDAPASAARVWNAIERGARGSEQRFPGVREARSEARARRGRVREA